MTGRVAPEKRIVAGDGDKRHGTIAGYCNHRCRCFDCKSAWANYRREARHNREPLADDDERHGKYTTYINWSCRCDPCTEAFTTWQHNTRATRRAERGERPGARNRR